MAKKPSDIVSGMGLATSIIDGLMKAVEKAGGTNEDIHYLATPEGEAVLEQVAGTIVGRRFQVFKAEVVVDCTKSLAEMIEAGKYDLVNEDVTDAYFSVAGSGQEEVEITLFHFNQMVYSEYAIAEMRKAGYRPATIGELLAFGAAYPELQKQFPITALGSGLRYPKGEFWVPLLQCGGNGRGLNLYWFGCNWDKTWRFAAVRK